MEIRNLVLGLAIVTLAVVIAGFIVFGGEAGVRNADGAVMSDHQRLEAILGDLRRNWKPGPRTEIFRAAANRIDELRDPLLALLSTPPHPLLKEAIELAAALDLREAQLAIFSLAETGEERVRPAAILAGERLGPWTREQLAHFLKGNAPTVLVATLEVSSSRFDRPLIQIVKLLGHREGRVRQAAHNAIPTQITSQQLGELVSAAQTAPAEEAADIIRALGKTNSVGSIEGFLIDRLGQPVHSIRMATLEALSNKGSRLNNSVAVWRLVTRGNPMEGAKALLCLERTKSFRASQMRSLLPRLDHYLKYFAARCLISAGDKEGVRVLIDLVDMKEEEFMTVAADEASAVKLAARALLADLSRLGIHADQRTLWEWYASLGKLPSRTLRLPPIGI